jgi:hypothetical protein
MSSASSVPKEAMRWKSRYFMHLFGAFKPCQGAIFCIEKHRNCKVKNAIVTNPTKP